MPAAKTRKRATPIDSLSRWLAGPTATCRSSAGSRPIVAGWKAEKPWAPGTEPSSSGGTDENTVNRIDLTTLGPLTWSPFAAEPFKGSDTAGTPWNLAEKRGKDVLIIFFLGGKCAHCMQQLELFGKEFESLKKLNVETIAIGTDTVEAARNLKNNKDGIKFPMPILADPKLELFKLYQAYDDFEGQPLHGTVLIDAQGNVRFQRFSSEPFLDVEFIKAEAARVNRITAH